MDVKIVVPSGTNIDIIEKEYPDIYIDEEDFEGYDTYFVGKSEEGYNEGEGEENQWMTYDEAVVCCGFVEGAIDGAHTLIEGNGDWAQIMLSRKNFNGLTCSGEVISEYKRISDLWWAAHERGKLAAGNTD